MIEDLKYNPSLQIGFCRIDDVGEIKVAAHYPQT